MVCATCGKMVPRGGFPFHECEGESFEPDADKLRAELAEAKALNQRLMTALETVGKLCRHRAEGDCFLSCPGRIVCDVKGLKPW